MATRGAGDWKNKHNSLISPLAHSVFFAHKSAASGCGFGRNSRDAAPEPDRLVLFSVGV